MKNLLILALSLSFSSLLTAQTSPSAMDAELLRSTTARTLDERGMANGTMPLKKGMFYPVVEQKMGYVVLAAGPKKIVVPQSEVKLSPRREVTAMPANPANPNGDPAPMGANPVAAAPFVPGEILLMSARYSLPGNQPRNVKNRLSKLIPVGTITAPVQILVTDELSSAAAGGNVAVVTRTSGGQVNVYEAPKNILTVEYTYNGKAYKKQAPEDSYLVLP